MITVHCRTNLDDVDQYEIWPTVLPTRPVVGDRIQSGRIWNGRTQIELEVVSTTFKQAKAPGRYLSKDEWYLEVELHLTRVFLSVSHWACWYDKIRGRIDHETYCRREEEARRAANV